MKKLQEEYSKLPLSHGNFISLSNNTIRQVDTNGNLERPFFSLAFLLACKSNQQDFPTVLTITASHNPPGYNGLKMDALGGEMQLEKALCQQIINDQESFRQFFTTANLQIQSNKQIDFFVGRDKRPSSLKLSSIIINVLQRLGRHVIDLGERSTPQVYSLSEFIYQRMKLHSLPFSTSMIQDYFNEINNSFVNSVQIISKHLGREWVYKRLCFDFSNGVGGESIKFYGFLEKYFEILVVNDKEYNKPNVNCGAEWYYKFYKEKHALPNISFYPKACKYYFYDGDADRLIVQLNDQNQLLDGDNLNACFVRLLVNLSKEFDSSLIKFRSIGNITSNEGLREYLQTLKVDLTKVPVGMSNLISEAKHHLISSCFQPNGHGCIFFSPQSLLELRKLSEEFWQAQLILNIYRLSRNNRRGYAFHNMLIYQLYSFYFNQSSSKLFENKFVFDKDYDLNTNMFENSDIGRKLLIKPEGLVQELRILQLQFLDLEILLRKSNTSPVLRLTVQGEQARCYQAAHRLDAIIQAFIK